MATKVGYFTKMAKSTDFKMVQKSSKLIIFSHLNASIEQGKIAYLC